MYKLLITIITIIIIIEFIILLQNNKNTITTSNISNNISNNNGLFNVYNKIPDNLLLKKITLSKDIKLENYKGYFYTKNNYGFYIYNNIYNLLENNKLYEFYLPVNIEIINIKNNNINYYV